ncbi:AAA domain, putative AbiEii toxin, Type IV TA system [anaerobic digester metagenome]|nr:ATP-binding protein [Clostridiaceae bacterium HFYG-1003]
MKILRIKVDGLPLYKAPFDVSFYAVQRVQTNHLNSVFNLFGNIYVNTAEAFIGINASGKTTALKVVSFTRLLLDAAPLNAEFIPQILGENTKTVFDVDFFATERLYHLNSEIIRTKKPDGTPAVQILSEKLWVKSVTSKVNKTNLLSFDEIRPVRIRDNSDEYLPDDVSIMIAVNKQIQNKRMFVDLAAFTNFNLFLPEGGSVPTEIISLLDPTIEYITVENVNTKVVTRLKFYGQKELVLYNPTELNVYLSSGTVKGVRVFSDAARVLKNGGYLIVDEVENHFNRELVASLLRLFMNKRTNPKGAVIIFSTHYAELLDEMERNDAIFVTRSDQGLTVDNLNSLLKRNDMKKSEVYQSDFLGGTAPKYKALAALQKSIIKDLEE